jgi:hypothetical protein
VARHRGRGSGGGVNGGARGGRSPSLQGRTERKRREAVVRWKSVRQLSGSGCA